jgi:hypothetical protein
MSFAYKLHYQCCLMHCEYCLDIFRMTACFGMISFLTSFYLEIVPPGGIHFIKDLFFPL